MAVVPAQIQSVNRSFDVGAQPSPFMTFISAMGGRQQRQNMQQELIKSAFPNLIATKQIRPAKPGEQTILPNFPWTYEPQVDLDAINKMSLINSREKEQGLTYSNIFNAMINSPYGTEMMDRSPEEIVTKMQDLKNYFDKRRQVSSNEITKVKKAKQPINGNPLSTIYEGQTVYLGEDGMYYTAQELGE